MDVLLSVFQQLGNPFGIGQELSRDAHTVDPACGNRFGRYRGRHSASRDDGRVREFFDVCDVLEVAVFGHIGRRMRPVPCVVSAVIRVEHVVSRFFQIFYRLFGFGHIAAGFLEFLARNGSAAEALGLADHGVPQRNGEILAATRFDRLNYFDGETVPVFETAAVFVGAFVDVFQSKLIQQITFVDRVHLDSVHARVHQFLCGFGVSEYDFFDLFQRHFAAHSILRPSGRRRAGCGAQI